VGKVASLAEGCDLDPARRGLLLAMDRRGVPVGSILLVRYEMVGTPIVGTGKSRLRDRRDHQIYQRCER
jgi:hypothetical protein